MSCPKARETELLVEELPEETMVYDRHSDRCHYLNRTAGLVWRHCDGTKSVPQLAQVLERELGVPADEALVRLTLQRLERANLLDLGSAGGAERVTRREVGRRLALTGPLAALLPVVLSMAAPAAAAAASLLPKGSPCESGSQCASGCCLQFLCSDAQACN